MPHPFAITAEQWNALLANGQAAADDPDYDARPLIKLCTSDGTIVYLIAELSPAAPHLAFGLANHDTRPMLRFVDLTALEASPRGSELRAEQYASDLSLTEAAICAERENRIRDYALEPCPLCDESDAPTPDATLRKSKLRPERSTKDS